MSVASPAPSAPRHESLPELGPCGSPIQFPAEHEVRTELSGFEDDDDLEEAVTPEPSVDDENEEFDEIDDEDFDDEFDDDFEDELEDEYEIEIEDEISAEFGVGVSDDDDDEDLEELDEPDDKPAN